MVGENIFAESPKDASTEILMYHKEKIFSNEDKYNMEDSAKKVQNFNLGLWGARYQVKEVHRSIVFYTKTLGFNLDQQNLPAFGQVSIRNLKLRSAISNLFSAVPEPRVLDLCPMAVNKSQVDENG